MIYKTLFSSMDISAQGLSVQRTRMNTISENLANVDTTRTPEGGAYRRKIVQIAQGDQGEKFIEVFQKNRLELVNTDANHKPAVPFKDHEEIPRYGVSIQDIVRDPSELKLVFDPAHPDADPDGYVQMPNVNMVQEMIDMITASRSYEANITSLTNAKDMIKNALKI